VNARADSAQPVTTASPNSRHLLDSVIDTWAFRRARLSWRRA